MIIGIDISQIVYSTGVSRYTKELVKNLLRIDKKNDYKLFAGVFRQKLEIEKYIEELRDENLKFNPYIKLFPSSIAAKIWNNFHLLPIEKFIGKVDLFHTSDFTQPPTSSIKTTTIHDLTPLIYPEFHTLQIVSNFKVNLNWIKKECSQIIAVSHQTKKDLVKYSNISEDKIKVVYEGVGIQFKPVKDKEKIENLKKKYGIKRDFILSVGTLEPRKNINKLIEAFSQIPTDTQLVLVGKQGWGEQKISKIKYQKSKIIVTGFIDDEDLPILYSSATCFIYPSLYEGFGLPVLEAMSCGCPVITSNISSLPEVAGDAAILIDPNNSNEIKNALEKIINNKKLQIQLSEKSLIQAQKFNWQKTAKETLNIFTKLLS